MEIKGQVPTYPPSGLITGEQPRDVNIAAAEDRQCAALVYYCGWSPEKLETSFIIREGVNHSRRGHALLLPEGSCVT